jgi:hypothetical protein
MKLQEITPMKTHAYAAVALAAVLAVLASAPALAKLPPPNDEAKAKAAEAAAKTAHTNKVAGYQLCKSMDAVAVSYHAKAKQDGKVAKEATKTDACADPGPFVYAPPAPASAPAGSAAAPPVAAPAAVPAAAPAAAAKPAATTTTAAAVVKK